MLQTFFRHVSTSRVTYGAISWCMGGQISTSQYSLDYIYSGNSLREPRCGHRRRWTLIVCVHQTYLRLTPFWLLQKCWWCNRCAQGIPTLEETELPYRRPHGFWRKLSDAVFWYSLMFHFLISIHYAHYLAHGLDTSDCCRFIYCAARYWSGNIEGW